MLADYDPRLHQLLHAEEQRQAYTLNLIASENYIPRWIRDVSSSVLTNKYAEGYPGKRFYAGCAYIDEIERMAITRCNELFNSHHANVQPHSGSQANMAAYFALANPGDKIMGMNLASGGHLTHGQHINFSGTFYHGLGYTVDPNTERLDYEAIADLAQYHQPRIIVAGASAYSREINFHRISQIAQSVDAYFVADIAHISGLIAAGLHQSPIPFADCVTSSTHKTLRGPRGGIIMCHRKHAQAIDKAVMPGIQGGPLMQQIAAKALAFSYAQEPEFIAYQRQIIRNAQALAQSLEEQGYRIVSGGTDNHVMIVDLREHEITGKAAEQALEKAGITTSRSCIPFDMEKPWITSGLRLGTPALTSRGMQEQQMQEVAYLIARVLSHINDAQVHRDVYEQVKHLCETFPLPS